MLLTLQSVEGVLLEVAAGGADQNLPNAKLANWNVILCGAYIKYVIFKWRFNIDTLVVASAFTPKGMTSNTNEHHDSNSATTIEVITHSPQSHSSVSAVDGNEQ
jgi:hypothetical protein